MPLGIKTDLFTNAALSNESIMLCQHRKFDSSIPDRIK